MKIKQAAELVDMTSKNIRFYEDQGLITPGRAENGYREYGLDDIRVLKQIKLLRKLGISIDDIKSVLKGEQALQECLEKGIDTIRKQKKNLDSMEVLANRMIETRLSLDSPETDHWLDEIEIMEKEGAELLDVKTQDIHRKKKAGASAAGIVMIVLIAAIAGLVIWALRPEPDVPAGLVMSLTAITFVMIMGIAAALVSRFKEIDGGEEDEARKY